MIPFVVECPHSVAVHINWRPHKTESTVLYGCYVVRSLKAIDMHRVSKGISFPPQGDMSDKNLFLFALIYLCQIHTCRFHTSLVFRHFHACSVPLFYNGISHSLSSSLPPSSSLPSLSFFPCLSPSLPSLSFFPCHSPSLPPLSLSSPLGSFGPSCPRSNLRERHPPRVRISLTCCMAASSFGMPTAASPPSTRSLWALSTSRLSVLSWAIREWPCY